jgi:4-hydroxy-3-methylbut-2-enyl diphosphate reductase
MILEKSSIMGYCNGVAHVINLAHDCLRIARESGLPAYSIGWFIHNPHVVNKFSTAGMRRIEGPDDGPPGVALIRAHGIGDPLREKFEQAGFKLIDGTCGTVAYSQRIIRTSEPSSQVVLIGQAGHSEVKALTNVYNSSKKIIPVTIVDTVDVVDSLPPFENQDVLLMVQTTFPQLAYDQIKSRMQERYGDRLKIGNRPCPITSRRHEAINQLCDKVDAVIVVGGKMSANTAALAKLVEHRGLPVWHIEQASEIPLNIYSYNRVGITAGTSTPPEDIESVYEALKVGSNA